MKVIFFQMLKEKVKKGEIKEVPTGYTKLSYQKKI